MTRHRGAVALAAALALLSAAPARATTVTGGQLHALAARAAAGDPAALSSLRAVSAVDGRPARLGAALGVTSGPQLTARLRALEASGTASGRPGPSPSETAASILSAQRYHKPPLPDPIGTVVSKAAHALGRLASRTPGGPVVFWLVLGAIVLALTALGARAMMRRLDPAGQTAARAIRDDSEDPGRLERDAQAAEAHGAFAEAVRLRFRLGLLLLGSRRIIEYRPSLLTTDVAQRLRSPQFDALASAFERITYGGTPAAQSDATAAREGWRSLLERERER
jgi:Domain of unknown function (DUF4129)